MVADARCQAKQKIQGRPLSSWLRQVVTGAAEPSQQTERSSKTVADDPQRGRRAVFRVREELDQLAALSPPDCLWGVMTFFVPHSAAGFWRTHYPRGPADVGFLGSWRFVWIALRLGVRLGLEEAHLALLRSLPGGRTAASNTCLVLAALRELCLH